MEEDLDPQQLALLEEPCILVDEADVPLGAASKRECHLMRGGSSPLHRAFSVFLFNSGGELLVHRRAHTKVIMLRGGGLELVVISNSLMFVLSMFCLIINSVIQVVLHLCEIEIVYVFFE